METNFMGLDDDSVMELTKFFSLWKNKWLRNFALSSKFCCEVVKEFLLRDTKKMIRHLGYQCVEFVRQGNLYLSRAAFSDLMNVHKSLKRCLKHEREIQRSLKTLKSSTQPRLFLRLMKLMSNNLLHTNYNDSIFDIVTRSLDIDEFLRKEEFVFNEIDKIESEIIETDEISQIYDLAPYLMCKDDPIKKIRQLSSLDIVNQISKSFNIYSGVMLIMLCKNLTSEETKLSFESIISNPSFNKMMIFSQREMLLKFLGCTCLHEGIDDEVLINKMSRTKKKARFLSTFYEKDHVIKRFQMAANLNLLLDFSTLNDFLDLCDDQLNAAVNINLFSDLRKFKYMKSKQIQRYKPQTTNFLMNAHFYPLFENFLTAEQFDAFMNNFNEFKKKGYAYINDLFARVFDRSPKEINQLNFEGVVAFIDVNGTYHPQ